MFHFPLRPYPLQSFDRGMVYKLYTVTALDEHGSKASVKVNENHQTAGRDAASFHQKVQSVIAVAAPKGQEAHFITAATYVCVSVRACVCVSVCVCVSLGCSLWCVSSKGTR